MCEEEERRQQEEVEAIERASAQAEAQTDTYAVDAVYPMFTPQPSIVQSTPQQSEEDLKKQREEARLARLKFYNKKNE